MAFVNQVYTQVEGFLASISETQFGTMADALGTTGLLMASIAAMLVGLNMVMQLRPMPWGESISLCVKLVFVALFFRNWTQFDAVASAVFDLLSRAGGAMIASVNGASSGETIASYGTFAQEFDKIVDTAGDYASSAASQLGVLGGGPFLSVGFVIVMGILSGMATFILVASRVVVTVLLGLAPLAILMTLFQVTKSWFERWLSAVVTFAIYPLVISGIFATIIGVMLATMKKMPEATTITSIGQIIPMFMVMFLSMALIFAVPMIVGAISGSFHLKDPTLGTAGSAARSAAGFAGGKAVQGAKVVAKDTAGFARNPIQNTRQALSDTGAAMLRMQQRFNPMSKK